MQSSIPASHDRRLDAYPDRQPPSGRRGVALVVGALVCATFGEGVLLGLVPAAIPGIGALFGTSAGDLTWVNTMQLLSTAVCTPVIARLGDMCGHRNAPLSRGKLAGHIVECPLHFAQFDVRSGKLIDGPVSTDVRSYEVKVDGGHVLVRR